MPVPQGLASPAEDLRHQFIAKYNRTRRQILKAITACEACGLTTTELTKLLAHLETHHVVSVERIFSESLPTTLLYDPKNLIVLCRGGTCKECHFNLGHDVDGKGPKRPSWKVSNPNVRQDAAKFKKVHQ